MLGLWTAKLGFLAGLIAWWLDQMSWVNPLFNKMKFEENLSPGYNPLQYNEVKVYSGDDPDKSSAMKL